MEEERQVKSRINDVGKVLGGMIKIFSCMGMNVQRLYKGVAVPTTLYGTVIEKKSNVMEMRCLRSICGVTCMDRLRNKEV